MYPKDLAEELQTLNLTEPEYLLFNPTGDRAWPRRNFDDVPRYLFRVSTPKSDGTTNRIWVKSKDAMHCHENSKMDVFESNQNQLMANTLERHLRWRGTTVSLDNFVSWTSSLLFSIQYIFYRHTHSDDSSSLDKIYLCIVDTLNFPKGTFLRDMDLISAYCLFNTGLKDLEELRKRKHSKFTGSYYFGEYLSQGALKVENKCRLVSAQAMVDGGLFDIQPKFKQSISAQNPKLANKVIELREALYQSTTNPQKVTQERLEAAIKIAQLFGPRWRLPMAANLIALLPYGSENREILLAFTGASFTGLAASPFLYWMS